MPPYLSGEAAPLSTRANRPCSRAGAPRGKLAAGAALAVVVIELAVAPLTVAVTAAFVLISRLSRWRLLWLIVPAVAGLAWAAAVGAGRAIDYDLAAAKRLIGVLAKPGPVPEHLFRLGTAVAGWQHPRPGQLPVVLLIAAAQAGIVGWSCGAREYRPGLLVAARRACVCASLRRGEMATPDGCCVGFVTRTGRRAEISWREAEGGVLVTGRDDAVVTRTALGLATAAIQHRKTVIIIDLTGGAASGPAHGAAGTGSAVADAVAAACAGVDASLAVFGAEGGLSQARPGGGEAINLRPALAERKVVLFSLDGMTHGRRALMVARLVIADLAGILADRARLGARADCLLWINGVEATSRGDLAHQFALGSRAGAVTLLSTAAGSVAGCLAGEVNVVVVRGRPPVSFAARAASAGLAGVPREISLNLDNGKGLAAALLAEHRPDELSFQVRSPRPRLVTGCRAVR